MKWFTDGYLAGAANVIHRNLQHPDLGSWLNSKFGYSELRNFFQESKANNSKPTHCPASLAPPKNPKYTKNPNTSQTPREKKTTRNKKPDTIKAVDISFPLRHVHLKI